MKITLIAAVSVENTIGDGEKMLWSVPEDLHHFKKVTTPHTVIMGRKTFESLGMPLPNRLNIVLINTRPDTQITGVEYATSIDEALELAKILRGEEAEVFVIGGGSVYGQTIDLADKLIISHIGISVEGSVKFPTIDRSKWRRVLAEHHRDARIPFTVLTYTKGDLE